MSGTLYLASLVMSPAKNSYQNQTSHWPGQASVHWVTNWPVGQLVELQNLMKHIKYTHTYIMALPVFFSSRPLHLLLLLDFQWISLV